MYDFLNEKYITYSIARKFKSKGSRETKYFGCCNRIQFKKSCTCHLYIFYLFIAVYLTLLLIIYLL